MPMRQVSRAFDPTPLFRHGSEAARQRQPVLDFSVNLNPLGPPPSVLEALRRELDGIGRYPDPQCRALKEQLATQHDLTPDHVVVGNGSNDLIAAITRVFPIRQVVIVEPTYTEYLRAALAGEQQPEHWLAEGEHFQPEPFPLELGRLVWLCNPNNPTGQLWRRDELTAWITGNPTTQFIVDEAFLPFRSDETSHSLIGAVYRLPNVVVLRSLTKFYTLPGLRLGYAVANPEVANYIQRQLATWSVNALAETAGLAALGARNWSAQTHTWLNTERPELLKQLRALPGLDPVPSQANFILLRLRERTACDVAGRLAERGIAVRDASNFIGLDDHYIRVAVRARADNQRLVEELGTLLRGG
jgi:threonine-phosphate decarboxylase